jgi:thymidylate synthase (FAD)
MNKSYVGEGNVVLLSGGGKVFTDLAARFVGTERNLDELIASDYDKKIVDNILNSNHRAATEFDYFVFGIEGFARVTEVQLVRKRLASYLIKSGRNNKGGKRQFDVVLPKAIEDLSVTVDVDPDRILVNGKMLQDWINGPITECRVDFDTNMILGIIEEWYNFHAAAGVPEEELRYMKPQATEFKALIGMNAHALLDWFQIRTCRKAQTEIRDLATKMMGLCKDTAPDLFANAGPNCKVLGYCPENKRQDPKCKAAGIYTKDEAFQLLKMPRQLSGVGRYAEK